MKINLEITLILFRGVNSIIKKINWHKSLKNILYIHGHITEKIYWTWKQQGRVRASNEFLELKIINAIKKWSIRLWCIF